MAKTWKTVDDILKETEVPAVGANQNGHITYINKAFEKAYGWTKEELIGRSLTNIMPPQFRDAHTMGFSRFLSTETARLAGKPLPLAVLYKDGTVKDAEHFILADKKDGKWNFAATIRLR